MGCLEKIYAMVTDERAPKDICPVCAKVHDPKKPHFQNSPIYQCKFYDEHGRIPTWKDAMEHCSPDIKELWQQSLKDKGIEIG